MPDRRSLSPDQLADVVSVVFASERIADAKLKRLLLVEFARIASPGTFVHFDRLEDLVMDLELGLDDEEIRAIVHSSKLWECRDQELRLLENIELDAGLDGLGQPRVYKFNLLELIQAISESTAVDVVTPTDIASAVGEARDALWSIARNSAQLPSALPTTFWSVSEGEEGLSPLGDKPSAITLLDIVNTTFEIAEDFPDALAVSFVRENAEGIVGALDRCVRYIIPQPNEFAGLIYVNGDDDFVEEDLLPNVPTVAHFLRALASEQMWRARLGLAVRPDAESQIRAGVSFLLDKQRPEGLWGVYRYDSMIGSEAPVHPYFTLIAIRALEASSPLLPDMPPTVTDGIRRAAEQLIEYTAARLGERHEPGTQELLIAFLEATEARLALAFALMELNKVSTRGTDLNRTAQGLDAALFDLGDRWALAQWRGDEVHQIEIHAPRRDGYLRPIQWEQPASGKLVYYLSLLTRIGGLVYPKTMTRKMDELAARIYASRKGALWTDIKLNAVFPSNSAVMCLALHKWLSNTSKLVERYAIGDISKS